MKILTIVGARPQFIKAAALSRALRKDHREILVHTGQHYDANMSDVFFDELHIPRPDYNLGISGGSHAQMTARMLTAIEDVLVRETPDMLLLYGDTNSTLAGALAAAKLFVPVAHVEAGNRLGTLTNPEEINRICTDHIASIRFACVESAMQFLIGEGLAKRSYLVGDPMYDAFLYYCGMHADADMTLTGFDGKTIEIPRKYYYLTCHREENTKDETILSQILLGMNGLDAPTIYPLHPRNQAAALALKEKWKLSNVIMIPAVGYMESIALVRGASGIVTDSGGVQREAFFAKVPCVTVFAYVVWPETMVGNWNQLCAPDGGQIAEKLAVTPTPVPDYQPFGDGHACEKIAGILTETEISVL